MLDPSHLAALAAIHRRGSFDLAADALGVTPSAISQRLKAFEERMGCMLIRRGTPCRATPEGLRLIRHFDDITALESLVAQDLRLENSGPVTLRIAVNADSLASWVIPALASVQGLLFDLEIDDQAHSQDWLRRGEVSAAVTSHPGPLQGCETVALGTLRYHATASPDFMARFLPQGVDLAGMAQAPSLTFSDKDTLQSDWLRAKFGREVVFPTHRIASSQAFVDAARAGLGWGMNPSLLVADDLRKGRLVDLDPALPLDVPLYWQFTRQAAQILAPVTTAMRRAAKAALLQP